MSELYQQERQKYLQHFESTADEERSGSHALKTTPLFSLAVRYAGKEQDQPAVAVPKLPSFRFRVTNTDPVDSASTSDSDASHTSSSESPPSKHHAETGQLSQYGLLGFHIGEHPSIGISEPIMLNTRAPNSTFLCGSQGSGKSYTLNCILENCLIPDKRYGSTTNPIAGIAFHYDNDDTEGGAEVASLCSRGVQVNVLVSSSNFYAQNEKYQALARKAGGKINVDRLLLRDEHLSIERLHKLMNISDNAETGVPLYVSVIHQILQQMAINGQTITLAGFERQLALVSFAPGQKAMLDMRLRLLDSLMYSKAAPRHRSQTNMFQIKPGSLTIVDLSDPFIDASMVCTLFGICLSIFLQARKEDGLIVALDEAHKYLHDTSGAAAFTEQLITTIRMQRHNGTRVVIATQEPTISGRLLDLCSTSIVHRFTSPAWFEAIKEHLSAASSLVASAAEQSAMFDEIVKLGTGEAVMFSPSSFFCVEGGAPRVLGTGTVKMKTRRREGKDLGASRMAGDGGEIVEGKGEEERGGLARKMAKMRSVDVV